MLPLELQTPREVAGSLARRVRAMRLDRGWTQRETAERAGLALATYRRFERSGSISLERLIRVAVVLDAVSGFAQLFALPAARSLAELEDRSARTSRKRGRRRGPQA